MKIRLAKKILFSRLYEKKHAQMRPVYWDEKKQRFVVPARNDIEQILKATKRYLRWYDNMLTHEEGVQK